MQTNELDYKLPDELIAQHPSTQRSDSRLLVLDRQQPTLKDHQFKDIGQFLRPGDLLVLNNTKVLPARFFGQRTTGARLEGLYLGSPQAQTWRVLLKGARKLKPQETFLLTRADDQPPLEAQLIERLDEGHCLIHLHDERPVLDVLADIGYAPLPPYIRRNNDPEQGAEDKQRYQTVYAQQDGAVAAPTAGLHFTETLLTDLHHQGIKTTTLTLHVGIGTFKPVTAENLEDHPIHAEEIVIDEACVTAVNQAKQEGRRVIAVGTTSTRALESAAVSSGQLEPTQRSTNLFITPGYEFKIIDGLITNFHLPKSTLIALVGALTGLNRIMEAYKHAVEKKYRFYSYGDAMLII